MPTDPSKPDEVFHQACLAEQTDGQTASDAIQAANAQCCTLKRLAQEAYAAHAACGMAIGEYRKAKQLWRRLHDQAVYLMEKQLETPLSGEDLIAHADTEHEPVPGVYS